MYYTEMQQQADADVQAKAFSKHSVLANPLGKGPREFIMHDTHQAYAEYILEIKVEECPGPDPSVRQAAQEETLVGKMFRAILPQIQKPEAQKPEAQKPEAEDERLQVEEQRAQPERTRGWFCSVPF